MVDLVAARLGRPHQDAAGRDLQAAGAALSRLVRQESGPARAGTAGSGRNVAYTGFDGAAAGEAEGRARGRAAVADREEAGARECQRPGALVARPPGRARAALRAGAGR